MTIKNLSTRAKCIISFVSGALIGATCTFFATKGYFKREEEAKIDAITKAYCEALDENFIDNDGDANFIKDEAESSNKIPEEEDIIRPEGPKDLLIRDEASKGERVDYTLYSKSSENRPENANYSDYIAPGPSEDNEDDNEEVGKVKDIMGKRVPKTRKPRIIKEEDFGMIAGYEETELFFYKGDQVLTGSDDTDIVDNPEYLIGDALTKYGFFEDDTPVIFVRNDNISTDFSITKVNSSYADIV